MVLLLKNFKSFLMSLIIFSTITVLVQGQVEGTFSQVVEGFNWGPCVTKMILYLNTSIPYVANTELDSSAFSVVTTKEGINAPENREIINAYISNESGNSKLQDSKYITLELSCHPKKGITNPFYYSSEKSLNNWADPYTSNITLVKRFVSGELTINSGGLTINTSPTKNFLKGIDNLFISNQEFTHKDITLKYAYYKSSSTSNRGVVIWLHGTGEGGTDTTICLYGNKVTNLVSDTIQNELNDCDILVVQCPSRWLTYTTGINTEDSVNTIDKYQSTYTESLYALIQNYVSTNKVSSNRIYIGGASNGGSMTMNMILNYPQYFTAAYFASEGYADRHITDSQIESIKNIPLWFVYAEGDQTNDPAKTTKATYDRLINANAPNVHLSYYSNGVVDTTGKYKNDDGTPYTYSAHWSWVYLLDNDCKKDNVYLFSWLGKQNNGINDEQKGGSNSRYINFKKINYLLLFFIILL